MDGAVDRIDPPAATNPTQAAFGGRVGVPSSRYADLAPRLFDNGYTPLPIIPDQKWPPIKNWDDLLADEAQVAAWCRRYPGYGIGLRTGHLVGLDIDILDPDRAQDVAARAIALFGETLIRVGRWPKRLLAYRVDIPFAKMQVPGVEVLARGQQFVAFGNHPATRRPYEWVTGESPADVALCDLPLVTQDALSAFLSEVAGSAPATGGRRPRSTGQAAQHGPQHDADGQVVDGRDSWLSTIAYHVVQEALDARRVLDAADLSDIAWQRFAESTDLSRPREGHPYAWSPRDAARKVADKLALHAAGRLPRRAVPSLPPPDYGAPVLDAADARRQLDEAIAAALDRITAWQDGDQATSAPVIGLRATVGLGKSVIARQRVTAWQAARREAGRGSRVLVVTPSHVLAEETAQKWLASGARAAVLRGYKAKHPQTGMPMCRDHPMVELAIRANLGVGRAACHKSRSARCRYFDTCLKQENLREVAGADVVIAPYDVLFSGPADGGDPFALVVIDEGCWQRAEEELSGPWIETLVEVPSVGALSADDPVAAAARVSDLLALRKMAMQAFTANGPGPVQKAHVVASGLTAGQCIEASRVEAESIVEVNIYPGMPADHRRAAEAAVRTNENARRMAQMWGALYSLIQDAPAQHVLSIAPVAGDGCRHRVMLHGRQRLQGRLAGLPILHLDATLRTELAGIILPSLQVTEVEAAQPHVQVTLVTGAFGKSALCTSASLSTPEAKRRVNNLKSCVDYVRWEARRVAPRRVLVVTYLAIEDAFRGIPGVDVAHFNAIAGLDHFRDVGLLIVIGRPLPSDQALGPLMAAFQGRFPTGGYTLIRKSVRLRNGGLAGVMVMTHEEPDAEVLRAAICDDEVIQAIGRGRGVNRSVDDPLEVQVLANLALPLVHDRVRPWALMEPDVFQRMLLEGIAVDSPADAALLHPGLLPNEKAAQKALERAGFKRHFPIENTYRGMSLKSARYRRGGRGRSWQTAWWIDGSADEARLQLEAVLGAVEGWDAGVI